jgi:hypothetical protein
MGEREKQLIREFVDLWIQTHKEEMLEFEAEMELERLGILENSISKEKTLRQYGSMPLDLQRKLGKQFPGIFKDKESNYWLFKEYPIFLIVPKDKL